MSTEATLSALKIGAEQQIKAFDQAIGGLKTIDISSDEGVQQLFKVRESIVNMKGKIFKDAMPKYNELGIQAAFLTAKCRKENPNGFAKISNQFRSAVQMQQQAKKAAPSQMNNNCAIL